MKQRVSVEISISYTARAPGDHAWCLKGVRKTYRYLIEKHLVVSQFECGHKGGNDGIHLPCKLVVGKKLFGIVSAKEMCTLCYQFKLRTLHTKHNILIENVTNVLNQYISVCFFYIAAKSTLNVILN